MATNEDLARAEQELKAADAAWTAARIAINPNSGVPNRLRTLIEDGYNNPSSPQYSRYLEYQAKYDQAVAAEKAAKAAYEAALANFKQIYDSLGDDVSLPTSTPPPANSGTAVNNAQVALDDKANSQKPQPPSEVLTPEGRIQQNQSTADTNAVKPAVGDSTTGTDDPPKTIEQTQSVAGNSVNNVGSQVPSLGSDFAYEKNQPSGRPGAGAANDDVKNTVRSSIDQLYGNKVVTPKPNILDQYASYTYSLSVYLMTPDNYKILVNSKDRTIQGQFLLFQSAGASQGAVVTPNGPGQPGRNPYFGLDYYIDNVELTSVVQGKGTGSAHNSTFLNFTVTEYNGITLLKNLDSAVVDYVFKGDPKLKTGLATNGELGAYASQIYLMVIKFYGYDEAGNLVTGGQQTPQQGADPQAIVEKYIPFTVKNITFKIANRAVEYQWECTTTQTQVNTGPVYATIPYNIQLSGKTLKDALTGDLVSNEGQDSSGRRNAYNDPRSTLYKAGTSPTENPSTGTTTPPTVTPTSPVLLKADAAKSAKLTITQGLMAALNKYQEEQVKQGIFEHPHTFSLEFASPEIASAKTTFRGGVNKNKIALPQKGTAADSLLTEKQAADLDTSTFSITAGMQIVQVLEQMIRNSTFITDQQNIIINPTTGIQTPNPGQVKNISWFKIGMKTVPKKFDYKRKDYAYDIQYTITPYRVGTLESEYFPLVPFPGFHKRYPYWFTGENTSVISFEQNYNHLYHRVLSGAVLSDTSSASYVDFRKTVFQPRSDQSIQNTPGRVGEPAANAADYLYSPTDQANVSLTIIGDPAWIFQGEASFGLDARSFTVQPFLADGSINIDGSQVYFEVAFNTPTDYDLNGSGLMDTGINNVDANRSAGNPGSPSKTYAYYAKSVVSHFKQGKFTQELSGGLHIQQLSKSTGTAQDKTNKSIENYNMSQEEIASENKRLLGRFKPPVLTPPTIGSPQSALAKGVQQILTPVTQSINPTLTQLQGSTAYITARRQGITPAAALELAKKAFAEGTPAVPVPPLKIVKDQ